MIKTNGAWRTTARLAALLVVTAPMLAGCGGLFNSHSGVKRAAFTSKAFGVAVSPRVTRSANPRHGGGRNVVGKPYKVHGEWYTPKADPEGFVTVGQASWYGADFHGRLTANGEIFNANAISGGSPVLPLPSYARVTNLENGRSLLVRFNDRGPYMAGRVVDLSARAADLLGYRQQGTARVQVKYVSPAPLNGDDTRFLMASLDRSTSIEQGSGIRLAMADTRQTRPLIRTQSHSEPLFGSRSHTANRGTITMTNVLSSVSSLFSYAEARHENTVINDAHAAVDAMATRSPQLRDWVQTTDQDARDIKLDLGVYDTQAQADDIAIQFAMLGAVDEDEVVTDAGKPAIRLVMSHLKPGVARTDVLDMVHSLGLKDVVLY